MADKSPCCCTLTSAIEAAPKPVPVSATLTWRDRLGAWRVRWGIGRTRYRVEPGLYAVGTPVPASPVLVSANFRMSFDRLRSQLDGLDAWILVLDTRGINVWCAAGKGTFGTEEMVKRVAAVSLDKVVSHRRLVVPQLGAPGVSAHRVRQLSGFRVVYGPTRAQDVPAFLAAGMKATPEMRRVRFPFRERLVLVPMEIVQGARYALPAAAGLALLAGLGEGGYSLERVADAGIRAGALLLLTFLGAAALTPPLLPWLPGRAFALKGAWLGLAMSTAVGIHALFRPGFFVSGLSLWAWALMITAMSSYIGMNFTGCSTYTSLSGVRREMRLAVPWQITGAVLGFALWITARFV